MWDSLSYRLVGDEYLFTSLMEAQIVETWDSPVYEFNVSHPEQVVTPASVVSESKHFTAPWE